MASTRFNNVLARAKLFLGEGVTDIWDDRYGIPSGGDVRLDDLAITQAAYHLCMSHPKGWHYMHQDVELADQTESITINDGNFGANTHPHENGIIAVLTKVSGGSWTACDIRDMESIYDDEAFSRTECDTKPQRMWVETSDDSVRKIELYPWSASGVLTPWTVRILYLREPPIIDSASDPDAAFIWPEQHDPVLADFATFYLAAHERDSDIMISAYDRATAGLSALLRAEGVEKPNLDLLPSQRFRARLASQGK